MDTSEYMPMFLAETREHLEHLNLAIVRLEKNPKDPPTVDEIFRIAHSLKGMSATMGFAKIAELTHAMEDVFELLRQRTTGLKTEAIDTVFACLDALSLALLRRSRPTARKRSIPSRWCYACGRSLVRPRTRDQERSRVGTGSMPADATSRSTPPRPCRRADPACPRQAQRGHADAARCARTWCLRP